MAGNDNAMRYVTLLSEGFPELGPGPRGGALDEKGAELAIKPLLAESELSVTSKNLVRALVLLWHDHFDPAHAITQGISNAEGSFVHGIIHRREPDYGNARYWFHRVGNHACFPVIAKKVSDLLESKKEVRLQRLLVPEGNWVPSGFVDACENAVRQRDNATAELLIQIQAFEFAALLEHLTAG